MNPSDNVYPGNIVTMAVSLASGTPPYTYAWRKDGTFLEEDGRVAGSASALLVINGVQPDDEGHYDCRIADVAGDALSESLWLIVGDVLAFAQSPGDQQRYEGERVRFEVQTIGGRGPLHYQWKFDDGQNLAKSVGADAPIFEISSAKAAQAGEYWCEVSDLRATYGSRKASLDVAPMLEITGQPSGGAASTSVPFELSVSTSGGFQPLSYAWRRDGLPAILGTDAVYTISTPQSEDGGGYYVIVSDDADIVRQSETAWVGVQTGVPALSVLGTVVLAGILAISGARTGPRRELR
jgi:hypothetical protein